MGRKYKAKRRYRRQLEAVWQALPAALEDAGMEVRQTDEASHTIRGKKAKVATGSLNAATLGGSPTQRVEAAKTFGERIEARVEASGDGTEVTVESKLRFGLIDWGENQKNVRRILTALDSSLK